MSILPLLSNEDDTSDINNLDFQMCTKYNMCTSIRTHCFLGVAFSSIDTSQMLRGEYGIIA